MYRGLLKQNRMFRLNETTELNMEEIHRGSCNSLAAVRMDFLGERLKACETRWMFSSDILGCPLLSLSNTVPVSINFLCQARMEGRDGGSLPYLVL